MKLPAFRSDRLSQVAVAILIVAVSSPARASSLLETINDEVTSLYEKSKESIVKVYSERRLQLSSAVPASSRRVATGFFINGDGCLLTTSTVIEESDSCWIEWRGREIPAKIVGTDPQTKIALLKVDPVTTPLPALPKGNSDDLRVGSMVVAIGFPYDLPSAPAVGFVSGLDIQRGAHVFPTRHVRAGCRVNPGQGGGPLLNARGEVVGVVVAAYLSDQCYALPINAVEQLCSDFLKNGRSQRGWVGLGIGERRRPSTTLPFANAQVYVQQVFSNTPAAEAGFKDQDILVRISTNEVSQLADVLDTMFQFRQGDQVTITVLRGGRERELTVMVGHRPPGQGERIAPVAPLNPINTPLQPAIVPASRSH